VSRHVTKLSQYLHEHIQCHQVTASVTGYYQVKIPFTCAPTLPMIRCRELHLPVFSTYLYKISSSYLVPSHKIDSKTQKNKNAMESESEMNGTQSTIPISQTDRNMNEQNGINWDTKSFRLTAFLYYFDPPPWNYQQLPFCVLQTSTTTISQTKH